VTIATASLNLLGATNVSIKAGGENLFQSLSKYIEPNVLVPSWANSLPFTNPKAKISLLMKFSGKEA
jgi:hypothetical protein